MSALLVAVFWAGTVGAWSANAWASERATGVSARAAATSAGWWRAAAMLVLAVASTVLTAAALRQLSPLGEWLGAPGIGRPVVAALTIALVGAIPGVAVLVVSSGSPTLAAAALEQDELPERQRAEESRGRRVVALVIAAVLGIVNLVVLTSVTALGEWVREGTGQRLVAVAVLALALATPAAAAVWYTNRLGPPWSRDSQA
jgi:hypothetical protein